MARIFKIKELEEKKRALAEECDLYRHTLRLEVNNLRLHASWTKRRFTSFTASPLWTILPPLLSSFAKRKKRKSSKWRTLSTALAIWQLYRKFRGFGSLFAQFRRKPSVQEDRAPAATI
jgi:hypothetical protein